MLLYENKTYKVWFNTLKNETEGYLDLLELATLFCLTKSDSRSFILRRAFLKSINYDVFISFGKITEITVSVLTLE